MKVGKTLGTAIICILLLLVVFPLSSTLVHAIPDSLNMYVTAYEEASGIALKTYLADGGGPLREAEVEYELLDAQGSPLGIQGRMDMLIPGTWRSPPLPLEGDTEVCALVRARPQGYPPQEKRYYFTVALAVTSAADESSNPKRENIHLGSQLVRQEFVWDFTTGVFKTVNIYWIGEAEDYIANMEQVLTLGAPGDGAILGRDCGLPYYYWQDGASWHTLADRTRYKGYDARTEATITRGDNIFTQGCADGYDRVASYEPWASIALVNGWEIDVTQEYTQWGHEVNITAPSSPPSPYRESWVYGDPHLLQAGGTQQQELAAIGEYVFHLGPDVSAEYTLNLICLKSNAGFSLVTAMNITGPDDYLLTMGRNGEVKVSGGSGGGTPQARPSLPSEPEIEFIEAPRDGATLYSSGVSIKVEANECLQNATLNLGGDSYPMTDMDGGKGLRWEKTLGGLDLGTYSFYVTGTDSDENPGATSGHQFTIESAPIGVGGEAYPVNKLGILAPWLGLAMLLISGITWFTLRHRARS
ncbi:MAG TPA: hypothetical protein G4N93_06915 [Dehalococcoidia bacterium]|nr:hypothetical protein [Dehalococcoidia bacterium]